MLKGFVIGIVVLATLIAGYLVFVLYWSYSSGERAGWVQKFSRKGWICKTWEGELAMANLPGSMPQVFAFTVVKEEVAAQINSQMGERVTIHYKEHRGLPTTCFGDTPHFVDGIRRVNE